MSLSRSTSSSAPPFEGPEKRLYVAFSPVGDGNMRAMSARDLDDVLCAASCSVLSTRHNDHLDAYLLSESSLFVADYAVMIKTCGSTTLLHALPRILSIAHTQRLVPVIVQYSRVRFQFPERQSYPHDSYANEVAFLNSILRTHGLSLPLPSSDWHVYIAQLPAPAHTPPPSLPQTIEVFMFDLDPAAMSHYMHEGDTTRANARFALTNTTVRSRISSLLSDTACVDAYNFLPCGYSLNSIDDGAYVTIHVSPEPQASYVSFESTSNTARLADVVAAVVKVFRPCRFTVSFLGAAGCAALRANPNAPVHWSKLSKLLGCAFSTATEPVLLRASAGLWAATASYRLKGYVQRGVAAVGNDVKGINAVLSVVANRFDVRNTKACCAVRMAREVVGLRREDPTFIVDLGHLLKRAIRVRDALAPQFALRYAVRCNSDRAVLMMLNLMGWCFEAVSMAEVSALKECGVIKEKIAFVSPMLTADVVRGLDEIGTLSLLGEPDDLVMSAIERSGVALEIRIAGDAVEDSLHLCESVLAACGRIAAFAVDCEADTRLLDTKHVVSGLKRAIETTGAVIRRLPPELVKGATVSMPELSMRCDNDEAMGRAVELLELCEGAESISVDVGRWVVGPSTSLVVSVVGRRLPPQSEELHHYYLNDGVYGAFSFIIMERCSGGRTVFAAPEVIPHDGCQCEKKGEELYESTLFGPTCDALDWIWSGKLPKLQVGDMLLFRNMGAYAASAVSTFNGFAKTFDTVYVN